MDALAAREGRACGDAASMMLSISATSRKSDDLSSGSWDQNPPKALNSANNNRVNPTANTCVTMKRRARKYRLPAALV